MEIIIQRPSVQANSIEIGKISLATLFDDDYFNGKKVGILEGMLSFLNKNVEVNPAENQQLTLDEIVLLKLCELEANQGNVISVDILLNGEKRKLFLEKGNGTAQIYVMKDGSDEKFGLRKLDEDFKNLKEMLASHIACKLQNLVDQLSKPPHCVHLDEVTSENKFECPDFVSINVAGSRSVLKTTDISATTTTSTTSTNSMTPHTSTTEEGFGTRDSGTMINHNGLFATTLVHVDTESNESLISAILTTAAIKAVEHGILICGLKGDDLHDFLCQTFLALMKKNNLENIPPFSNGVVLFQQNGEYKKLEFSCFHGKITTIVSDAIPDPDFPTSIDLVAMKDIQPRNALHVSIDAHEYFFGKDDFIIFPRPQTSINYKHVKSELEIAQSELSQLKLELEAEIKNDKSDFAINEFKTQVRQKTLEIQNLRNNTTVIHVKKLPIYAQDYEGHQDECDSKFHSDLRTIVELKALKEELFELHVQVAQQIKKEPPKLESSDQQKLFDRLIREELSLSKKLELSKKLDLPLRKKLVNELRSLEKGKLSEKLNSPVKMSQSEKSEFGDKVEQATELWSSGQLAYFELGKKAAELFLSEKLVRFKTPKTKVEQKQAVIEKKEKALETQQDNVNNMLTQREEIRQQLRTDLNLLRKSATNGSSEAQRLEKQISHKDVEIKVLEENQKRLFEEWKKPTSYDQMIGHRNVKNNQEESRRLISETLERGAEYKEKMTTKLALLKEQLRQEDNNLDASSDDYMQKLQFTGTLRENIKKNERKLASINIHMKLHDKDSATQEKKHIEKKEQKKEQISPTYNPGYETKEYPGMFSIDGLI